MNSFVKHEILNEDIIRPSASNSLKLKNLVIEAQDFYYHEKKYSYSDIKRISIEWTKYKKLGMGESNHIILEFDISGISKRVSFNAGSIFIINLNQ